MLLARVLAELPNVPKGGTKRSAAPRRASVRVEKSGSCVFEPPGCLRAPGEVSLPETNTVFDFRRVRQGWEQVQKRSNRGSEAKRLAKARSCARRCRRNHWDGGTRGRNETVVVVKTKISFSTFIKQRHTRTLAHARTDARPHVRSCTRTPQPHSHTSDITTHTHPSTYRLSHTLTLSLSRHTHAPSHATLRLNRSGGAAGASFYPRSPPISHFIFWICFRRHLHRIPFFAGGDGYDLSVGNAQGFSMSGDMNLYYAYVCDSDRHVRVCCATAIDFFLDDKACGE